MVLTFRSAAALRSQRLLVRYGLLEAQLHRGVMQCWQGMVSAALKRRCWQGQYDRCSCTWKRGGGGKVRTVISAATLAREAMVVKSGSLWV